MGSVEVFGGGQQIRTQNVIRRALRLAAVAGVCASSTPAAAQEIRSLGLGAFLGFNFGRKPALEWGFEAFGSWAIDSDSLCRQQPTRVIGPLAQLAFLGPGEPRTTLALHAAFELEPAPSSRPFQGFGAELGFSARFLEEIRYGVHTGVLYERTLINVFARQEWLINDFSVGGGARLLPTFGVGACTPGRPVRNARGEPCMSDLGENGVATATGCDPELGRAWSESMQHEQDSVFAFLQLAVELDAAGAPPALVERALASAGDEIIHALLCAHLAARFRFGADAAARATVRPRTPADWARPCLPRLSALRRLAAESVLDGCLNEGIAAAEALEGAAQSRDTETRRILQRIAKDEKRHEALAWDVLGWSLSLGGASTRAAVRDVYWSWPSASPTSGLSDRSAYGWLGSEARLAVRREKEQTVKRRLNPLLRG